METEGTLETFFKEFRKNIIGIDAELAGPYGKVPLVYADWIASGRLYGPVEDRLRSNAYPYVANTHSESSAIGAGMTQAYLESHRLIKKMVGANENDVILTTGSGMTGVINKLQRLLGLRIPERSLGILNPQALDIPDSRRPVVFVTHMEHHSNHTSWLESLAEVVVLKPDQDLHVVTDELEREIVRYADRPLKIGSFSAASNVTGVRPPYRELARIMHRHGGIAFVDFAAAAPYDVIDMHPQGDPQGYLDAVFFSPHKFLGGPGSPGVLVFNKNLYANRIPDNPGGGTVTWTDSWGDRRYFESIELREDGGTPAFLGSIRAALAMEVKEKMGADRIHQRENELLQRAFEGLDAIPKLRILAPQDRERIGALSFYIEGLHYNLVVRLLSDRYGIQTRGGCSCAGTYGHYLLHLDRDRSNRIAGLVQKGDLSEKPGWVRVSVHPTMTDAEMDYVIDALKEIEKKGSPWAEDYRFNKKTGEFERLDGKDFSPIDIGSFYSLQGL